MEHTMRKQMKKAVIILFWLIVWQIAAVCIDNHILLVGPVQVLNAFAHNVIQPDFFKIVIHSFARIGLGFFLALFAGLMLGTMGYRFRIVEEILAPAIQAVKSIPVASFVVLLLIWFGSQRLSFFISFLIVFPNVYVNMIAGLKSADIKLLEMAQVFGIGRAKRFFYIYRPAVMPYLNSCLKISLGMSWKSGVAAEVIGLPDYSMGERLYMSKIYLDTAGLLAWTFTIILVSFLFEKAVLKLIKIFADWKPYPRTYSRIRTERCNVRGEKVKYGKMRYHPADTGTDMYRKADGKTGQETKKDMIQVQKVDKFYTTLPVLQNFNMSLVKGQRYLLMAPSGGGKTTLLKILIGLENVNQGEITGMPEHIGMVFQEDRLCEEYDVICNIMLGMTGWLSGKSEAVLCREVAGIIEYVRQEAVRILPEECLTKQVNELSGGMRRRAALLRAVMSFSDMLILDEPFVGLDEENRLRCAQYLMENLRGRTLLVTTHREDDVELLRGIKITL
ncbi:MAG: ATP-binding cassette domain-containing protein [Lachnospiraceae bacterium]|nr:ATP-binding cassette domain-containing protein [Lachnospiraceae bacterium]